jgi:hypothetical protein
MRYLCITYVRKPGGQIDEQVTFTKEIKTRDLQQHNVIIDYSLQKVVKCVIEGKMVPTSFEIMHDYYKKIYPNVVEQLELSVSKKFEKK